MIANPFSRTALHQHADPAQRLLGVAALPPDSGELAQLLLADPSTEVRIAAAQRCADLAALASAWEKETDAAVRPALAAALGGALAQTQDSAGAQVQLAADGCTDAIRVEVALHARDAERRRAAIAGVRDEAALMDIALHGEHAETRMAAAERVSTPDGLRKLADAAKNKDHGVARLARQRIEAIKHRSEQDAEAELVIAQLEALAAEPGPILTAVIELNRRWQALDLNGDAARLARCESARQAIQARFEREQNEQRLRVQFERKLNAWIEGLGTAAPAAEDALAAMRTGLAALREEAQGNGDDGALARLAQAQDRIAQWERELQAAAGTLALVLEAEQLAAGTSIDHAELPARWQALDRSIRTPELTRRFEAAMTTVEQRRLAQIQATQQEANAARQQVHALLHAAEQALAAGQVQAARAAADQIKALKTGAGLLPKPTTQRLGRLVQQLVELERWESFGQQNARVQLCERAEAAATQTLDPPQLALEVQKLRNEWKALDQQHAGVPKALWERFDGACEKAYAPAARYFSELAAQRKEARKRRDEFIAAAAAHATTPACRTRRLARDRALAARNRPGMARRRSGQRRSGRMEKTRPALQGGACAAARGFVGGARARQGGASGPDRRSDGAVGQSDGARAAVAGQGDPGEMAGRSQGPGAGAARRARAVEPVSRRLRRGVRRAPEQAQGRGRPQERASARLAGTVRADRTVGARCGQGRSGNPPRAARSAGPMEKQGRHIESRFARA